MRADPVLGKVRRRSARREARLHLIVYRKEHELLSLRALNSHDTLLLELLIIRFINLEPLGPWLLKMEVGVKYAEWKVEAGLDL